MYKKDQIILFIIIIIMLCVSVAQNKIITGKINDISFYKNVCEKTELMRFTLLDVENIKNEEGYIYINPNDIRGVRPCEVEHAYIDMKGGGCHIVKSSVKEILNRLMNKRRSKNECR